MKKHGFFTKSLSVFLALLLAIFVVPAAVYAEAIEALTKETDDKTTKALTTKTEPALSDTSDADSLLTRVGDEVFEDISLREENVKHFRLADGSYSAYLYDLPVHILDENGEWQDIDNTLTAQGENYTTSNARIKFAKKITGNETIFTLHEGNHKLTLSLDGAIKKTEGKAVNTVTEFDESATLLQKLTTLDKLSSRIIYENILKGVDLEYIAQSRNIKENIIVKEKNERYVYTFTLALNNLSATLLDDGSVSVYDDTSKETIYTIPTPTVFDANGEYAPEGKAYYTLESIGNGKYALTVTADESWMNDEARSFPVTIDPPIYATLGSNVVDLNISPQEEDRDSSEDKHNWVSSNYYTYWKVTNLPTFSNAYLVNATYYSTFWASEATTGKIGVYPVMSNWDSTLTWNKANQATNPPGQVGERCYDYAEINYTPGSNTESPVYEEFALDLTALVKQWNNGERTNFGICLKPVTGTTFSGTARICSNDHEIFVYRPQLVISYRKMSGVEDYWSTVSQNAGYAGTGSVNLRDGYLIHAFSGWSTTDGLLPYTPTFYYNSATKNPTIDSHEVGHYWRGDFQQTLEKKTYSNSDGIEGTYYIWTDADGTEHAFMLYQSSSYASAYYDEDGLGLQLIAKSNNASDVNTENYIIETRYNECYYFNSDGQFIKYEDAWGNSRLFTRDEAGKVITISIQPQSHTTLITQLSLSYNTSGMLNKITYVGSGKQIRFFYSSTYNGTISQNISGYLRKIEYHESASSSTPLATVEYTYTSNGHLQYVYDNFSECRLLYSWSGGRVSSVQEYSKTSGSFVAGQKTIFTYQPDGKNKSICRTSGSDDTAQTNDDILTHYTFDIYGRTVSTYVTDVTGKTVYGTTQTEYTENSVETVRQNNRITNQTVTGRTPINYLKNGSFLSSTSGWTADNSSIALYHENNFEKAVSLRRGTSSGSSMIYQDVTLEPGEYTFSARVRLSSVSGTAQARLKVAFSSSGYAVGISPYIGSSLASPHVSGYVPISVSFTVPSQAQYRLYLELDTSLASDVLYADDLSLVKTGEEGMVSLLNDSSFDNDTANWVAHAQNHGVSDFDFGEDTRSLHIYNSSANDAFVSQTVTLMSTTEKNNFVSAGEAYSGGTQTYVLSGYGRADFASPKKERAFALSARITYLQPDGSVETDEWIDIPFSAYTTMWQYTSGSFTTDPTKGCPYRIEIACSYRKNVGNAYFDDVVLVRASNTVSYEYNDSGNVSKAINGANESTVRYTYDSGGVDVKEELHSDGTVISRTFVNHKVEGENIYNNKSGISLPSTANTYNSYGQLVTTLIVRDTDYTATYYTYSTDHASWGMLETVTTPLGETVYLYSNDVSDYGMLYAVVDENDNGSYYFYDEMGRQTEVWPLVNGTLEFDNERVIMDYDGAELVSVETASTEYGFTYNDYGAAESVSVGTNQIVRYLYNAYNGKLRYVVYANGYIERYDYDELDRIASIWYYSGGSINATDATIRGYSYTKACDYIYNGEGNLAEYRDHVTGKREVYTYGIGGRVESVCHYTLSDNTIVLSDKTAYTYDANARLSGSVNSYLVDGTRYTYTTTVGYDAIGRVTGYTENGATTSYSYHPLGMIDHISMRSGVVLLDYAYTYATAPDPETGDDTVTGRVSELEVKSIFNDTSVKTDTVYTYTYDDNDNITEIRIGGVLKYSYEYDNLNQLIRENNRVAGETYVYAYDDAGNILSKQIFPYNTMTTSELADAPAYATYHYSYGQTVRGDRLKEYRNAAITYDAIGNPIFYHNGSDYSFTWQNGRQLKSATKGGSTFLFTYDAEGRRTSKDSYGSTVIYYVWDGDLLVAEYVPYETIYTYFYDASGSPVGFTYTDETGYYEGGVPSTYFYEKNLQGDIVGILDCFGNRIVQYDYDAWGNLIRRTVQSGDSNSPNYKLAEDNPFRYRGYYYDRETGFYYLQSRYYDPVTGRFISPDTTDVLTATPMGLTDKNLYAYCDNNPVVRVDHGGQFWETFFDVISLGASIVEVCVNPTDPWAWAGLAGDAIDLIPFVTGVGEGTRAVKTTVKVVDKATDVVDTAKTIYKTADAASDIRKATGSYEILYKSGKNYIGKGGFNRAITSATRNATKYGDEVTSIMWKSAPNSRSAFIDEYLMQKRFGGVLSSNRDLLTYNKIWSPGRRYFGD